MRTVPTVLALAVALVLAIFPVPAASAWREHEHAARGWTVSLPPGWQLRLASRDFIDPSLCMELRAPGDHRRGPVRFHGSQVGRRSAEIRVVQLLTGRGPANERRPFRLSTMAPPGGVEWTEGGLYTFRERSRSIYVGLLLGADAGPGRRRNVERIVNSLRMMPRPGRCPESPRSLPDANRRRSALLGDSQPFLGERQWPADVEDHDVGRLRRNAPQRAGIAGRSAHLDAVIREEARVPSRTMAESSATTTRTGSPPPTGCRRRRSS